MDKKKRAEIAAMDWDEAVPELKDRPDVASVRLPVGGTAFYDGTPGEYELIKHRVNPGYYLRADAYGVSIVPGEAVQSNPLPPVKGEVLHHWRLVWHEIRGMVNDKTYQQMRDELKKHRGIRMVKSDKTLSRIIGAGRAGQLD